ncbi:MAG: hypothetical protein DRH97_01700 [Chloroflexi bacterium]|nr:MAG: hypothetical protein DRH97_01700 [Chloroflexota bacterium]
MSTRDKMPLWVFASACKHFNESITGLDVFNEGTTRANLDKQDWCELRIDGPWITDVSHGVIQVKTEINVLVGTVIDDKNLYRESINHTRVIPAFRSFKVYKYGPEDDVSNDGSCVGVMVLEPLRDQNKRVEVARFGQIDPAIRLLQSTIEGHFQMTIFV